MAENSPSSSVNQLFEDVLNHIEEVTTLTFDSSSAVENKEKILRIADKFNTLAKILEDLENEYLSAQEKGPNSKIKDEDSEKLAKVGSFLLNSEELCSRLRKFLSSQFEPNLLKARCGAARLLLVLVAQQSIDLDEFVNYCTLLIWAYADGYEKYADHQDSSRKISSKLKGARSAVSLNALVVQGDDRGSWFQTNAEERRLRADTKSWWREDSKRKDAKSLRQYSTGLLAFACTNRNVAMIVMNPHRKREIFVPFPVVLLKRINEELYPHWESNNKDKEELCDALRCAATLGDNAEMGTVFFTESILTLLHKLLNSSHAPAQDVRVQFEALDVLCRIGAHKKLALQFVEDGGVENILKLARETPKPAYLHGQIMYCLAALVLPSAVLEKIVQRPRSLSEGIMGFALDLLSNSQDMARLNALGYISSAIVCPMILEMFDSMDGPKTVLNIISSPVVGQQGGKAMQLVNMAMYCLRQYVRTHVAIAARRIQLLTHKNTLAQENTRKTGRTRSSSFCSISSSSSAILRPLAPDKLVRVDDKAYHSNLNLLEQSRDISIPHLTNWKPVEELLQYQYNSSQQDELLTQEEVSHDLVHQNEIDSETPGTTNHGIELLLAVVAHSNLNGSANAIESATFALEVLRVVTLLPFTYELVCCCSAQTAPFSAMMENAMVPDHRLSGMTILLDAAVSANYPDSKKTVAALEVLCNCCSPSFGLDMAQRKVRILARRMNALMTLLSLLRYEHTPKAADRIRYLSCLVLLGLANDKSVAQVLDNLQIASTLSKIARSDPVLVENRKIHKKLQNAALELIQLVSGRVDNKKDERWLTNVINEAADATKRKIQRVSLVARTEIMFDSRELLSLVRDHLESRGLFKTAQALTEEANLVQKCRLRSFGDSPDSRKNCMDLTSPLNPNVNSITSPKRMCSWPCKKIRMKVKSSASTHEKIVGESQSLKESTKDWKIMRTPSAKQKLMKTGLGSLTKPPRKRKRIEENNLTSSTSALTSRVLHSSAMPSTTLERMVQEHLREQHRNCPNPICLVPPFSLQKQNHRCPTDRAKSNEIAPFNSGRRLSMRKINPPQGGKDGQIMNTRLLHSKSRFIKTYKWSEAAHEEHGAFDICTCVRFYNQRNSYTSNSKEILCGTDRGDVVCFDTLSGASLVKWHMGSRPISKIRSTPNGKSLIICSVESEHASLWNIDEDDPRKQPINMLDYNDCFDVELDSKGQYLLGSTTVADANRLYVGRLYELATGKVVRSFGDSSGSNQYTYQTSSIGPTDKLVCVDGVLWDIRMTKKIHKFDKLSKCGFSVFHPAGTQLIINTAVWDLRNFNLFLSCKPFQESILQFDNTGDVIYGYRPYYGQALYNPEKLSTTISITGSFDYRSIGTKHVEKGIRAFDLDPFGQFYAVVADKEAKHGESELECKLYEIGLDEPDEYDSDAEGAQEESEEADDSDDSSEEIALTASVENSDDDEALFYADEDFSDSEVDSSSESSL